MHTTLFTEKEIEFIRANYPHLGLAECSKRLNVPTKRLSSFLMWHRRNIPGLYLTTAAKSKISKSWRPDVKDFADYNVNPGPIINVETPEAAYFLGLLWADGYIQEGKAYSITLTNVLHDAAVFKCALERLGKWNFYTRPCNKSMHGTLNTTNKPLVRHLVAHDYKAKSHASADKILATIPEHLKHYWFRGLFDGDGHVSRSGKGYEINVSSCYDQDWTYMERLFKTLGIEGYRVFRREVHKGRMSLIRISNKADVKRFGDYIYQGWPDDKIGLERKHRVWEEMMSKPPSQRDFSWLGQYQSPVKHCE